MHLTNRLDLPLGKFEAYLILVDIRVQLYCVGNIDFLNKERLVLQCQQCLNDPTQYVA